MITDSVLLLDKMIHGSGTNWIIRISSYGRGSIFFNSYYTEDVKK